VTRTGGQWVEDSGRGASKTSEVPLPRLGLTQAAEVLGQPRILAQQSLAESGQVQTSFLLPDNQGHRGQIKMATGRTQLREAALHAGCVLPNFLPEPLT
jgi:hypothetical protein